MKVVIIGSGNAATVLSKLMQRKNFSIVQIASRNIDHAKILADELGCNFTDFNGLIDVTADIYIIAVADHAVTECFSFLKVNNKPVVHTAGSISKVVLKSVSNNYGILYPLQTLRKEMQVIPPMPILIDANNEETLSLVSSIAAIISSDVQIADDETRIKLHLAAVFVNNFTNHLYAIAEDFCKKEEVDFNILKPLIIETANRIKEFSPASVQTGPAIRNDVNTIDTHLKMLNDYPKFKTIYLKLTDSIMNF